MTIPDAHLSVCSTSRTPVLRISLVLLKLLYVFWIKNKHTVVPRSWILQKDFIPHQDLPWTETKKKKNLASSWSLFFEDCKCHVAFKCSIAGWHQMWLAQEFNIWNKKLNFSSLTGLRSQKNCPNVSARTSSEVTY